MKTIFIIWKAQVSLESDGCRRHVAARWLKKVHQPVLITSWPSVLFWDHNYITDSAKSDTWSILLQRYRRFSMQVLHRCLPEQQTTLKTWYTIALWRTFIMLFWAQVTHTTHKHPLVQFNCYFFWFLCAHSLRMFTLNLSQEFYFLAAISHYTYSSTSSLHSVLLRWFFQILLTYLFIN